MIRYTFAKKGGTSGQGRTTRTVASVRRPSSGRLGMGASTRACSRPEVGRSCGKGGVVVVVDAFFWGARLRRRNAFAMHHYGAGVGDDVGPALGVDVGTDVGPGVGPGVVDPTVGAAVGLVVGAVGPGVGPRVGTRVGHGMGCGVGPAVGMAVGLDVGVEAITAVLAAALAGLLLPVYCLELADVTC